MKAARIVVAIRQNFLTNPTNAVRNLMVLGAKIIPLFPVKSCITFFGNVNFKMKGVSKLFYFYNYLII